MVIIKLDRLISVSSEDPAYPAENLLSNDPSKNKKWKSKGVGERSIVALFHLEKSMLINGIDVGNENSAFIEVLVGKSCLPDDFKVLLIASSMMTMKEAKEGINGNNVRFFKVTDFCKPEVNEKWDRVKIVCTQPYNKIIQFGLSFITFHSSENQESSEKTTGGLQMKCSSESEGSLGRFNFKNSQDEDIAVGSIFARRKELEESNKGAAAAAIRAASAEIMKNQGVASSESQNSTPVVNKVNKNKRDIKTKLEPENGLTPPSRKKPRPSSVDDADITPTVKNNPKPSPKPPKRDPPSAPVAVNKEKKVTPKVNSPNVRRVFKKFGQLFEGVVFVISGFQNPLRGEIRGKAMDMGAKYKADWDRSCTHLICAFPNTPKFNQVRGLGKIVKKEWIEESYTRRTRFPWRRFAMEKSATQQPESEEEIYEETDTIRLDNRRKVGSEDEDEIKPSLFPVKKRNTKKNVIPATSTNLPSTSKASDHNSGATGDDMCSNSLSDILPEERSSNNQKWGPKTPPQPEDERTPPQDVHCSTDSDPEWNDKIDQSYQLPYLPEQFNDLVFFVSDDYNEEVNRKIERYIISHSGSVSKELDENVEYIIAERKQTISHLKNKWPQIIGVQAEWVWRCHDENRLLPTSKFEV